MNRRHLLKTLRLGALTLASMPLLEACGEPSPTTQMPTEVWLLS